MARIRTEKVVFTFHTTTQAIFMEKCCKEAGAAGRLIPVPRQISSGCGMAWCAQAEARPALEELIQEKGVETEAVYELLL
ncbi:MAG: DUF3343 domain-containing protein [Lachnospiraceae bacterium]|nr:DUF3343 domain-containing protein [Lachnospiraceae bacterium]MDO5549854.1 DUF3343 domain-containing protein [Lachnospiraceae bacterium]